MRRIGSALVLAILTVARPALVQSVRAQDADQLWNWCFGQASDDLTLQGCAAVIDSKRGTAETQAGAYYHRGVAHRYKGQLEEALEDYSKSIELNPSDSDVF